MHSFYQSALIFEETDQPCRRTPLSEEARLGLVVLLKILVTTMCAFYPNAKFEPGEWLYDTKEILGLGMERNGWCKYEWLPLQRNLSLVGLVYLAAMELRKIMRDHRFCGPSEGEKPRYSPRHISDDGLFPTLGLDANELVEVVENGKIPLLTFEADSDGSYVCRLTRKSPGTVYVATSHVCSERLGHMVHNSLPICRLQQLQADINTLSGTDQTPSEHESSQVDL